MGKRSDFVRRKADAYDTIDPRAVRVLLPHLKRGRIRIFSRAVCDGMSHLATPAGRHWAALHLCQ